MGWFLKYSWLNGSKDRGADPVVQGTSLGLDTSNLSWQSAKISLAQEAAAAAAGLWEPRSAGHCSLAGSFAASGSPL